MSDSLALAAVTVTLRNLLQAGFDADAANVQVITRPPDKVQLANNNKVNLFLYHTVINAHWRNMDVPWRVNPGETGHTPLPLNLHYLVTAYYGESEEGVDTITDGERLLGSHRLLGRAMSILHDHMLLDAATIHAALPTRDRAEHPYDQVEHVRIVPQPLSLDELSKLWAGFQTQYRPSAAYQASVVLIESTHPVRAPLPVLRRGPEDKGVFADLLPLPALTRLELPPRQPSLRLGETLIVHGQRLEGEAVRVRLRHPRLEDRVTIDPEPGATGTRLTIQLPIAHHLQYPAGVYTLAVLVTQQPDGRDPIERVTEEKPFALAPVVTIPPAPTALVQNPDRAMLTLRCRPEVWPEQHVSVLLDGFESQAEPHAAQTDTVRFDVSDIPIAKYLVRLRIDGVDSLPILNFGVSASPLAFDEGQKVTLIPYVIIPANPVVEDPADNTRRLLVLKCKPDVWPHQDVALLIAGDALVPKALVRKTDNLAFDITDLAAGTHTIHLRVDGITSAPDVEQQVTIP